MNTFILFTLFIFSVNNSIIICNTAKILAVTPMGSKSHHHFMQPIFKELALRGHQITLYTSVLIGCNVSNIKEIKLDDPLANAATGKLTFNILREAGEIPYFKPPVMWYYGLLIVDQTLQYREIQNLIHSNEKYDLILLEANFGQEAFLAFSHKFRAPVISLHTFSTYFYTDEFIGNPHAISYRPATELPYTEKMSFLQRCHNTLRAVINIFGTYLYYLPEQERLMRKYFNYTDVEEIPPLIDMLLNVSLTIVNSHISVDYARPWVPNVVEVAGVHISHNPLLPKDLQEFMDNSKDGVIYVSFGSVLPSEEMPDYMKEALIKAFAKLRQNVLWKLSVDSLPGLSKNVKLSKWLPQQGVLAHPNCLAFITHGGLLSQEEAIYFGVPLIGIPIFADQHLNVVRASYKGFAVHIDQHNISEESVLWAIKEVLYKPSYQENARKISKIFQDNQNPPLQTAVYWIEYVLRHDGALHLHTEGRKFSFFKYFLLDVLALMCIILFLIILSIYWIIKFIYRLVNNKRSKHKVKFNKKDN
ncbi:UDP-glycosyltransferase UGT5-like [Lycorma delicatula]|uniref:UDP-glycosyltransferase UGT5-like n=1 Tax=Lycorma delicatula TaxID=130591 RepID=UPI003F5146F6